MTGPFITIYNAGRSRINKRYVFYAFTKLIETLSLVSLRTETITGHNIELYDYNISYYTSKVKHLQEV